MGMYDTVNAVCPKCGKFVSFQSKAGDKLLDTYYTRAIPLTIAIDLDGACKTCTNCGEMVILCLENEKATVAMEAY